ncbi:MAG: 3'-5' exonuclease [Gemmatimonadetes bacterium]|nr:3'-5' exonuclease [Gemmatimonadota bacterium]
MPTDDAQELEQAAARLVASGDYQVLRRFAPPAAYEASPPEAPRRAVVVDVETTGLDPARDRIIEFAAAAFTYDAATGAIHAVEAPLAFLEDPGRAIPPEIVRLTGISDDMVAGRHLDDDAIARYLDGAQLIIAHNAGFDRKFVERRLSGCAGRAWACSQREVGWRTAGYGSQSLEYLLYRHAGCFFAGHRATVDCQAVVHVLATPFASGARPRRELLEKARTRTARLWAVGSPFESKDLLKRRGYRWSACEDNRPKAWYKDLPEEEKDAEVQWLEAEVYRGTARNLKVDLMDARTRFRD